MILSPNKKIFSQLFSAFSGIYIIFGILWNKRWASEVIFFWNYRLQKAALLQCTKSWVSEHLWTVNMLKGLKHCINLHGSIFVWFFDHSERKSAGSIWNSETVCEHIDTRWQVFSLSKSEWVFNATNSNAIISKSKNIFWIFFCLFGI